MKKVIIILIIILLISGGGVTYIVIKNKEKNDPLKKINIFFDTMGGSEVSSIELECGKELKLPENPIKEGYNFAYWMDKNSNPIYDNVLFTCEGDITLYANWEEIKEEKTTFQVSFVTGTDTIIDPIIVNCGEELKLPEPPTKEGYVFFTWYDLYGTPIYDKALLSCEDITLKAAFQELPKSFKVIFDSKGGSNVSSITVECDKELKLPSNPTKEGYTFRVWEDKHGTPILDGALFTCDGDVELYAVWDENE